MRRLLLVVLVLAAAAAAYVLWPRPPAAPTTVSVFFTTAAGSRITLAETPRTVPGGSAAVRLRGALGALFDGPTGAERATGLATEIPEAARLLGVEIRDGVARVNVSRELGSGGGSTTMLGRVWQIVYTATQFADATEARILVEGREVQSLGGEGVLLDRPLARPPQLPVF